jgi:hypothetical protein
MGDHSSRPDRPSPGGPAANETTWVFSDPEPVTQHPLTDPAGPPPSESHPRTEATFRPQAETAFPSAGETVFPMPGGMDYPPPPGAASPPRTEAAFPAPGETAQHPQTEMAQRPPAEVAQRPRTDAARPAPATDFVRYGPGVPMAPEAGRAGLTAEDIWRTGLVGGPAPRRRPRLRRALGSALTVLLLAVAAVILFLRFHHAPFAVTSAVITQQTRSGCSVDVTGEIATSGGAGTVSYQWVFKPDTRPPTPLTQTVIAGQKAVFVTVAVEGSGQGSATQSVTLQVLGPDKKSAATSVVVRC